MDPPASMKRVTENRINNLGETKITEDPIDKLSDLPQPLLHHILSFLPTKNVFQTILLSKSWKQICYTLPSVDLYQAWFHSPKDFVKFVRSIIHTHARWRCNIDKLRLLFEYDEHEEDFDVVVADINYCIHLAIKRHNIHILNLESICLSRPKLTPLLFTSSSLELLKLVCVEITMPTSICLPLLRSLHLTLVKSDDNHSVETLLSSCPVLETLVVENCVFSPSNVFTLSVPSLKILTIKSGIGIGTLMISTPNLVSLTLYVFHSGSEKDDICFIDSPTLLTNAFIAMPRYKRLFQFIRDVLETARSVELRLVPENSDIQECFKTPFRNLKCLKLHTSFTHNQLRMMKTLLKYSFNVDSLVVEQHSYQGTQIKLSEPEEWMEYSLPRLKTVKIYNFQGTEKGIKFVKFLLENATALEQFVFVFDGRSLEFIVLAKIAEDLLSLPRASSIADVFMGIKLKSGDHKFLKLSILPSADLLR